MKSFVCLLVLAGAIVTSPVQALPSFNFETIGFANPSDCTAPPVPFPACVVLDVFGTANDVGDAIPGTWNYTAQGQVLFGLGGGNFIFDDVSAQNNDFFGSWTNVLMSPDPSTGIAQSFFRYIVTGSSGIFGGARGFGMSSLDVVVAPFAFDNGVPIFAAACDGAPARIGSFCERGSFTIPEPNTLALLGVALLGLFGRRRTSA